jgi:hypothetical protein
LHTRIFLKQSAQKVRETKKEQTKNKRERMKKREKNRSRTATKTQNLQKKRIQMVLPRQKLSKSKKIVKPSSQDNKNELWRA